MRSSDTEIALLNVVLRRLARGTVQCASQAVPTLKIVTVTASVGSHTVCLLCSIALQTPSETANGPHVISSLAIFVTFCYSTRGAALQALRTCFHVSYPGAAAAADPE
jgi:hypothetical protein